MVTLITNGDDLGISPEVNRLIYEAYSFGTLTSTTILAGAKAFYDAVQMIKDTRGELDVGVHLALSGPFNISKEENSIVDASGMFRSDICGRLKFFRVNPEDLVAEYSFQIEKVLNAGIRVSHLDHHHHLHRFKPALDAMIQAGKKYGVQYIRPQLLIGKDRQSLLNKIYRRVHHIYLTRRARTVDSYFEFGTNEFQVMVDKLRYLLEQDDRIIDVMLHPGHPQYQGDIEFLKSCMVREILISESKLTAYSKLC